MDGIDRGWLLLIAHSVRGQLIQNYLRIFSFLLIWDKSLGYHIG